MVNFWNLKSAKPYLYPEIKVKEKNDVIKLDVGMEKEGLSTAQRSQK